MLDGGMVRATSTDLLDHLPEKLRAKLRRNTRVVSYAPGSTICLQGDGPTTLKIVQEGWVKLYRISPEGEEAVITTLSAGSSFDEVAALLGGNCGATVDAVTACRVQHIDLRGVCDCDDCYRVLSTAIMAAAASHMHAMINHVEQLKTSSSWERLADFLLCLASENEADCDTGNCCVDLPFERKLIAGVLGIKPESLSRAFNRLKPYGVTSPSHRIVHIDDLDRLRDLRNDGDFPETTGKAA
ncbi:Crp/Fnr family transcriptional regulator [Alisedimentitalea sp. MJ-SS2]|uniref:Crp/Fnr family transcriptional regulator n=1 Tax=Aliisedimentitalea sp. MJ-SS2 TaxID=3049795 RepID=UPI00290D08B3|nr:Crp/Fnr family transcriptional regulator [Alisedimentitalea sp. MJ-SS2]MDU8927143.1 Crp/Fnr family transcriptional regulator [Alisedimentitalea sp. MJ-SS2]